MLLDDLLIFPEYISAEIRGKPAAPRIGGYIESFKRIYEELASEKELIYVTNYLYPLVDIIKMVLRNAGVYNGEKIYSAYVMLPKPEIEMERGFLQQIFTNNEKINSELVDMCYNFIYMIFLAEYVAKTEITGEEVEFILTNSPCYLFRPRPLVSEYKKIPLPEEGRVVFLLLEEQVKDNKALLDNLRRLDKPFLMLKT